MEPVAPLDHSLHAHLRSARIDFQFTHAVFAAVKYGGKLSLTLSDDPRWIDAADGFESLESFVRELKASLRQCSCSRPTTTGTTTGKSRTFSKNR